MAGPYEANVFETTETQGTGAKTLAGAVTGARTFRTAFGDGPIVVGYVMRNAVEDGTFEEGFGTFAHSTSSTLTPLAVTSSSNSDAAVDWGGGTKNVWCAVPAKAANGFTNLNAGDSAPSQTFPGQPWHDTTNDLLKIRNQDDDAWITLGALDESGDTFTPYSEGTPITLGTDVGDVPQFGDDGGGNAQYPSADGSPIQNLAFLSAVRVYTAGDTWSKPAGLKYVEVELRGGGGGGGGVGGNANPNCGGGGGEGGWSYARIAAGDLDATETVTVGAGGDGGAAGANDGATGGTTSFGPHLSATGGGGGEGIAASGGESGDAGLGGTGSGGDANRRGSPGQSGAPGGNSEHHVGGAGGGEGGGRGRNAAAGETGVNGGGGGGANSVSLTARAGGDGGDGWVIVKEYS